MRFIISILLLLSSFFAKADEGMWLVHLLRQQTMQKMQSMGCELSYEQIYSETNPSLKDAIVSIDNGACTGSIISTDGLMLTNYHCALEDVQRLSSIENNYLANGYRAGEEIHIPGKRVSFLDKVIDVTEDIKLLLLSKSPRLAKNKIISAYSKDSDCELDIKYINTEDKYCLFFYRTYTDIRLVAFPPSSIANFGADRDNFSWPQHKCDFALYRVYGDSLSNPASFSIKNIPIKAKYAIPIAKESPNEGDFTLCLGYPFHTDRYISSYELKAREKENNVLLSIKEIKIDILKREIFKSEQLKIKYSSILFDYSNQYKKILGESTFISKYKLIEAKEILENTFSCSNDIKYCCDSISKYKRAVLLSKECFALGSELFSFAFSLYSLDKHLGDSLYIEDYLAKYNYFYNSISLSIDKKLAVSVLKKYFSSLSLDYRPVYLSKLFNKFNGDIDNMVGFLYSKTIILDKKDFLSSIHKKQDKKIINDPLYLFVSSVIDLNCKIRDSLSLYERKLAILNKDYIRELKEEDNNLCLYPDANSSLRLSFGNVKAYTPKDGVLYKSYTRLSGLVEKNSLNISDYEITENFKDTILDRLRSNNSIQRDLKIGFVTTNDITSGSSGSPILNSKGELVAIAYDGNWESLSGNYFFHPDFNRAICLDYKYISFFLNFFHL